ANPATELPANSVLSSASNLGEAYPAVSEALIIVIETSKKGRPRGSSGEHNFLGWVWSFKKACNLGEERRMQHERLSWVVSVALIWLLGAGRANAQPPSHKLSLDLYLEFEEVTDPQISPDGKQVVFTRRWVDKLNDKWESALWVMNADGSRQRFLRKGSSARWSPDGTRIAYLADGAPKGTQIFVYWMDAEGATTQLTHVEKPPANLCWSPDSRSLAFSMLVPKLAAWNIKLPPRPDGAKWTKDPRIVERLVYRADRMG